MSNKDQIYTQASELGITINEHPEGETGSRYTLVTIPAELVTDPNAWIEQERAHYRIEHTPEAWVFSVWDRIPSPDVDDIYAIFDNKEAALECLFTYAMGGPSLINGWLVPYHRHPELSFLQSKLAILDAIQIDQLSFERICEQRYQKIAHNRLFGSSRWEWAMQYQFIPIAHLHRTDLRLQLRRDCQEAYIVQTLSDDQNTK